MGCYAGDLHLFHYLLTLSFFEPKNITNHCAMPKKSVNFPLSSEATENDNCLAGALE
jgi:hypothetical protein